MREKKPKNKKTTEFPRGLVVCPMSQLENGARILNPDLLGFNSAIFGINLGTEIRFFNFVYSLGRCYLELGHKLIKHVVVALYTLAAVIPKSHWTKYLDARPSIGALLITVKLFLKSCL